MAAENPTGGSGLLSSVSERTMAEIAEGQRVQALYMRQRQLQDWIAKKLVTSYGKGWFIPSTGEVIADDEMGETPLWLGDSYVPSEYVLNRIGLALMCNGKAV